ncbi:MAG: hypothetical protein HQM16_09205 [Deltaproteobacteria bacterium]|nr:hypothetical protein [Deltaproteobacteria bacterium]
MMKRITMITVLLMVVFGFSSMVVAKLSDCKKHCTIVEPKEETERQIIMFPLRVEPNLYTYAYIIDPKTCHCFSMFVGAATKIDCPKLSVYP